jgi:bifunctional UDP-N-acetylglucosamine pyrophosphorylase / glucosamine-1-phosphate N-acetyltransferase
MVQVIILAGGLGKRMRTDLPKVLVPFHHKPMIVHVICESLQLEATQILIVVGQQTGPLIQKVVEKWFPNETHIRYIVQDDPQGTGHAVSCCLPYLVNDDQTIILSGDVPNINHRTLKSVFQLHPDYVASNVLGQLLAFEPDDNSGYGRVVEEEGNLLCICEEKDCTDSLRQVKLCNAGVYCITSKCLTKYIPKISNNNKSNEYYLPDIFQFIIEDYAHAVKVCMLHKKKNAEVMGVNTREQLEDLEKKTLSVSVRDQRHK